MSSKIRSTMNFVKNWVTENRREDTPLTILSNNQEEADAAISNIVSAWNNVQYDENDKLVYQCYLKSVHQEKIYIATEVDVTSFEKVLSPEEVFNFIIENKVRLIPTSSIWVNSAGESVTFVTHDVHIGKEYYQGMSVSDCINTHINKK